MPATEQYADLTLACRHCRKPFMFSADEQLATAAGAMDAPKYCDYCRSEVIAMHTRSIAANCSRCRQFFISPTRPVGPVLCPECVAKVQ